MAFIASMVALISGAGAAHADTGNFRITHSYIHMRGEWEDPGRMATEFGTFLQSLRGDAGHWMAQDTSITQNGDTARTPSFEQI